MDVAADDEDEDEGLEVDDLDEEAEVVRLRKELQIESAGQHQRRAPPPSFRSSLIRSLQRPPNPLQHMTPMHLTLPRLIRMPKTSHPQPARHPPCCSSIRAIAEVDSRIAQPDGGVRGALVVSYCCVGGIQVGGGVGSEKHRGVDGAGVGEEVVGFFVGVVPVAQIERVSKSPRRRVGDGEGCRMQRTLTRRGAYRRSRAIVLY